MLTPWSTEISSPGRFVRHIAYYSLAPGMSRCNCSCWSLCSCIWVVEPQHAAEKKGLLLPNRLSFFSLSAVILPDSCKCRNPMVLDRILNILNMWRFSVKILIAWFNAAPIACRNPLGISISAKTDAQGWCLSHCSFITSLSMKRYYPMTLRLWSRKSIVAVFVASDRQSAARKKKLPITKGLWYRNKVLRKN